MFFRRFFKVNSSRNIAEKIKNDLNSNFQRKGIKVRDIKIDFDYNYMNLKVLIHEK